MGLFILSFTVVGFFLPKEDKIVVTREIKCSPEHTYSMIQDLKNWGKWDPWHEYDPNMKVIYGDISSGNGAWYTWEGNKKVGKGKLSISNTIPNRQVDMVLNFSDFGESLCGFNILPNDSGSKVSWYIQLNYSQNSILKNIFGGYYYLMMKFFMDKDFNRGLDNLNNSCN